MEIEKCVKLFSQSKSNYLHLGQHCPQMYFPWFWIRNFQNQISSYSQFQSCRNALVSSLMPKCWEIILVDIECSLLFKPGKVPLSPLKGWSNISRIKGLEISQEMVWSLRLRISDVKLASCHSASKKSFWGAKGQTWHSRKHKLREGSL